MNRWAADSAVSMTAYLDPETQVLDYTEYTVQNDAFYTEQVTFGEDYKTVNALAEMKVGPLRREIVKSGSLYDISQYGYLYRKFSDSVNPQAYTQNWFMNYDVQSDAVLYANDKPFTGKVEIECEQQDYRLSVGKSTISLQLPIAAKEEKLVQKALRKYYRSGKHAPILELYNEDAAAYDRPTENALLLLRGIDEIFNIHSRNYDYEEYGEYDEYPYDEARKPGKKTEEPYDKSVSGAYLNGKPEGEWIVKDQFGRITKRVFYTKGELEGKATYYAVEHPLSEEVKTMRALMAEETNPAFYEDSPEKKTYYVARTQYYKNGMLNGPMTEYNWKGDTLSFTDFREGLAEGMSFERNKIFYTAAGYEYGNLDGISRTYMTLPGRDSILIFDLNFQNGALQGESRSYHTNGKLAKRGFFLGGEPIDDFEAFDTLGFKYQYVKFQFNQPVEEKIWEENQLSVRYLFNWQDSIPFNTRDIAGSSSFERLASDLGLIENSYATPYYGRPSLVDKTGIDYTITKYYPNDTIAREGKITKGKKTGHWSYFNYDGKALYEVDYTDTIIVLNDSIRFKSKGILTYLDDQRKPVSKSHIIEKIEKYDCSHSDHNEERMLYTFWERDTSVHRINGYTKNYYDNGAIQNEGYVENGLPTGVWKLYDSNGNLSQVGTYKSGKRDGRWLSGDLSNVKNMTEICLNPNLENLEEIMAYQEKLLDVSVIYYGMGTVLKREYYGINLNNGEAPENYYGEDDYYDGEYYGE
jgi:antitoxin component YwqK of YwqJK toxin-antitoxin module